MNYRFSYYYFWYSKNIEYIEILIVELQVDRVAVIPRVYDFNSWSPLNELKARHERRSEKNMGYTED